VAHEERALKLKQAKSVVWGRTFLTACMLMLTTNLAFAGQAKISKDLEAKLASGQVDVIVQYSQVPTSAHHQKVISRGGTLKRELGQFKGAAYTMPASALADLAADPEVVYITPDRPLKGASTTPAAVNDYHTATINAPAAWAQGLDGTGIGVAVIDSGIADLPDLHSCKWDHRRNRHYVNRIEIFVYIRGYCRQCQPD
jgi:serine protease AprX